jgi:acetylornithine deacetylase
MNADVVEILCELVAIPSVNPMGQGLSGDNVGEERIARYVAEVMREAGMEVTLQPFAEGRANALCRAEGTGGRSFLLEAHTDTVIPTEWDRDPFVPLIEGDRLTGLGACDTKGSLAAMMAAAIEWLDSEFDPSKHGTLVLLADGDEEHQFRGLSAFGELGLTCDGGVVGEPTSCEVVTSSKSVVRWRIHTRGRAVHSSDPAKGSNAIYAMARIVAALERFNAEVLPHGVTHPRLGPPTLSVGTIHGGTQVNTVPEHCVIEIDRRVVPGEDAFEAMNEINDHLRKDCGLEFEAEDPFIVGTTLTHADDAPIVQAALAARRAVLGESHPVGVLYGSNAGRLTEWGTPCLLFGPGDIDNAHQGGESVSLAQLRQAKAFYLRLVREWTTAE